MHEEFSLKYMYSQVFMFYALMSNIKEQILHSSTAHVFFKSFQQFNVSNYTFSVELQIAVNGKVREMWTLILGIQ